MILQNDLSKFSALTDGRVRLFFPFVLIVVFLPGLPMLLRLYRMIWL